MNKSQEEIEEVLISRFISNLEFLKSNCIEVFKKVELLSTALNDGLYEEKYALEYIKDKDDFDILDIKQNTYLYNKNFKNFNNSEVSKSNLTKSNIFNNLNMESFEYKEPSFSLPETKYRLLDELLHRDINSLNSAFADLNSSDKFKYIDKMFFLGTLLGGHIESSINKVKPKVIFIIEENLELFRLSLFITNYKEISEKTHILFSIMDERSLFMQKLNLFISEYFQFSNYNIKYSKMPNFDDGILNLILSKLHLENPFIFDYTKVLHDTSYFISRHINKYNILSLNQDKKLLTSFLENKPALFIGAGPSFSKNIDWIYENQDKFIIIAMGAVYKKLFDAKIRVDIVTTADSQYEVLDKTHFNKKDVQLLKNCIVLASIGTPTKILDRFNKDKLFLFETYQSIKDTTNCYNGASIGEVTLNILLDMNFKRIYMLGIDLAIDSLTGMTHYEGYENTFNKFSADKDVNSALKGKNKKLREEFLEVKGVFSEKVITTRVFALSLSKYEDIIHNTKKEEQLIYNLSTEAAYINGVNFLNKEDLNCESIENKDCISILKSYSEFGLSKNELNKIAKRISNIEILLVFIKTSITKSTIRTLPQFIFFINELFENIIKTEDYICSNLLANYFKVSLPYIYKSLNDEKVKPKVISKKIEQLHKILIEQVNDLVNVYLEYLKNIKKEK